MDKKQSDEIEMTIYLSNYLINSGQKRKRVYIFPCFTIFFTTTGLKITDGFIFQKFMFAYSVHFVIMGH